MKNFVINHHKDFQLRVRVNDCAFPLTMKSLEFVQETLDATGQVCHHSTYQFFLTEGQLHQLCQGLLDR